MIRRLFIIRFHRRFSNERSKNNRQHQRQRRRRNEIERRTRKCNRNRKKNRSNSRSNRRMSTNRITSANGTIAEGNTTLSLSLSRSQTNENRCSFVKIVSNSSIGFSPHLFESRQISNRVRLSLEWLRTNSTAKMGVNQSYSSKSSR